MTIHVKKTSTAETIVRNGVMGNGKWGNELSNIFDLGLHLMGRCIYMKKKKKDVPIDPN